MIFIDLFNSRLETNGNTQLGMPDRWQKVSTPKVCAPLFLPVEQITIKGNEARCHDYQWRSCMRLGELVI